MVRASLRYWRSAPVSRRRTRANSTILAKKMVHVTNDAKASQTITILTMMSADMNIDHGDNSCGTAAAGLSATGALPPGVASAEAAGVEGATVADVVAGVGVATEGVATEGVMGDDVAGDGCAATGAGAIFDA